jgi:hypothetical protein
MLEEMCEAAPTYSLVLGANMKPLVDMYHRELPVHVENDLKAIGQAVFLEAYLWYGSRISTPRGPIGW